MKHLVLLGDSTLDNAAYTAGGPAVITHVARELPEHWKTTLGAVDGATTEDIEAQLQILPQDATHLLLSVGGNNALLQADVLDTPITSSGDALLMLYGIARAFEVQYRAVVAACLKKKLPLVVCTVYHGNFPDAGYQQRVIVALTVFNDAIIRIAAENGLTVIDLRTVCSVPEDYANPIEPSVPGGAKIAKAIVRAVTEPAPPGPGAHVVAA
ncbi:MAG: SGNH/GDSL hydrolase family protein [Pseudomonadota bacterium]